jgi:hypothetical protein
MKVGKLSEAQSYQNLLKAIPAKGSSELAKMQAGDFFDWFEESYDLAVRKAYGELPKLDPDCGSNSVSSRHIANSIPASFLANATHALALPHRAAIRIAQS